MLMNYIKIALRDMLCHKKYAIINIVGLALGITCCLFIFLYIQFELSFDGFHNNSDRIYRIVQYEEDLDELSQGSSSTSALLQSELKATFPEIQLATRISQIQAIVKKDEESYYQSIVHVDPDFFQMFSFPLISGDAESALKNSSEIILTTEMANKYFGTNNPIGQLISVQLGEDLLDFYVSGVIEEAPVNSSIQYDFLISTELLKYTTPEVYLQSWELILFSTFVKTSPGTDINQLEKMIALHLKPIFEDLNFGDITFLLQPIEDIHLNPDHAGEMVPSSNPIYCYILGVIAVVILLVACMNFIILSIGRSTSRAREIGLRKVMGAARGQIIGQFWGEAFIQCLLSMVLSIALIEALLPKFNELAQKQLSFNLFSDANIILILLIITLVTTFLAGSYPALLLSRFIPIKVFRGNSGSIGKNRIIKGLVIMQFSVSIFLIISILIMSSQINYINNADLGIDQDYVVTIPAGSQGEEAANLVEQFRTRLSSNPEIASVTGYSYNFGESWLYLAVDDNDDNIMRIGEDISGPGYSNSSSETAKYFYVNWVDSNYIPTFGLNLVEGRNFHSDGKSDYDNAVIINRSAADMWGLAHPIGEKCPIVFTEATIVGVVEDFHYYPLQRNIDPMVLHLSGTGNVNSIYQMAVRIKPGNITAAISTLEKTWKEITNGNPFNYSFLDESISSQYFNEQRWFGIIKYSFILSMFITCLGLFGFISLAVAKKTKEIGIRKVLGADIIGIIKLLLKDFLALVLMANILAWPVAYYVMDKWLDNFAYKIEIKWYVFALSAGIALIIMLVTVSNQAIKAARANPVDTLRYE